MLHLSKSHYICSLLLLGACQSAPTQTIATSVDQVGVQITRGANARTPLPQLAGQTYIRGAQATTDKASGELLYDNSRRAGVIPATKKAAGSTSSGSGSSGGSFSSTDNSVLTSNAVANAAPTAPVSAPVAAVVPGADIENIQVAEDFDYSSTRDVALNLKVLNPNGKPYTKVQIKIYSPDTNNALYTAHTQDDGELKHTLRIPAHFEYLNIQASAIGIHNEAVLPITSTGVSHTFGEPNLAGGMTQPSTLASATPIAP